MKGLKKLMKTCSKRNWSVEFKHSIQNHFCITLYVGNETDKKNLLELKLYKDSKMIIKDAQGFVDTHLHLEI